VEEQDLLHALRLDPLGRQRAEAMLDALLTYPETLPSAGGSGSARPEDAGAPIGEPEGLGPIKAHQRVTCKTTWSRSSGS
jgi:hypothetical protein